MNVDHCVGEELGSAMPDEFEYGPVVVRQPGQDLRIGYWDNDEYDCDDDCDDDCGVDCLKAIVYYGDPPFSAISRYYFVDPSCLSPIDTDSLWSRRERLQRIMADRVFAKRKGRRRAYSYKQLYEFSVELMFVNNLLADRMVSARINEGKVGGRRVFISYSSSDHQAATWLSVDLANESHLPWLDEWEIKAGESIPNKIARGIEECDHLLVLLSPKSVGSGWVEREWSAKY
ncbi:toll/interleukin-1 receptor domain-containing protein [Saccharopolyspora indica]|uniref:toll/interleukin-1 receptor domain-containing protein n=1 Tax=Saccharopolyspora indica TaxID=1229659 RepID=UPI0022EA605B|nr:toll/interleukin-1 receptor domain-containing protein [Saccharopolyspora indica]MDA3643527.1 toll/interleukin-1 receptor domain-containing protein [Saccharopolyspora indica]